MIRRRLEITGRVQGVGFRYFALQAARRHGVVGFVENRRDGSVQCEAQGSEAAIQALVRELREGPGFSRVEHVAEEQVEVEEPGEAVFEIR